jgi:endonuclease YncB( thermonuclease family)
MSTRAHSDCAGSGRWTACILLALVVALPGLARAESDAALVPLGCGPEPTVAGVVAAVTDGRTFALDDGREVRLAGIEVPAADEFVRVPGSASAAQTMAHLAALVAGRTVALGRADRDRYGRFVAQVFVLGEEPKRWVQADMLTHGHARVAARGGEPACVAALRQRERAAREAQLGLWADPYYGLRRADDPAAVSRERGRFAIVEGRVVSVRESGGTLYVNFGGRWSSDFTVTIAKRQERAFAAAGLEPKRLAGRRIQVRGWIEERGGPWIEATAPEQIEVVERH